jgi:hypothetical protein
MEPKIFDLMQTLCFELRAIELWNTAYGHNQAPQEYERDAFRAEGTAQGDHPEVGGFGFESLWPFMDHRAKSDT